MLLVQNAIKREMKQQRHTTKKCLSLRTFCVTQPVATTVVVPTESE